MIFDIVIENGTGFFPFTGENCFSKAFFTSKIPFDGLCRQTQAIIAAGQCRYAYYMLFLSPKTWKWHRTEWKKMEILSSAYHSSSQARMDSWRIWMARARSNVHSRTHSMQLFCPFKNSWTSKWKLRIRSGAGLRMCETKDAKQKMVWVCSFGNDVDTLYTPRAAGGLTRLGQRMFQQNNN